MKSNHLLKIMTLLGCVPAISACQHVNVAQITYEVLRAEDCRRNQLEDFCARTYASEYYHYERMRQEFLRDQQESKRRSLSDELLSQNTHSTL